MTKKELLKKLTDNFLKVEEPQEVLDNTLKSAGMTKYLVGIYWIDERNSDVLHRKNVAFVVDSKGNAYFYEGDPTARNQAVKDEFREELESKYDNVERVLTSGAIVRKIEEVDGQVVEKRVFVDKETKEEKPFVSNIKEAI